MWLKTSRTRGRASASTGLPRARALQEPATQPLTSAQPAQRPRNPRRSMPQASSWTMLRRSSRDIVDPPPSSTHKPGTASWRNRDRSDGVVGSLAQVVRSGNTVGSSGSVSGPGPRAPGPDRRRSRFTGSARFAGRNDGPRWDGPANPAAHERGRRLNETRPRTAQCTEWPVVTRADCPPWSIRS